MINQENTKREYLCNKCLEELEKSTIYEGGDSRLSFDSWGEIYNPFFESGYSILEKY